MEDARTNHLLVDAEIIKDADRFKMDLIGGLERTLHGQLKPMITQCSMRHLYAQAKEPGVSYLIDKAKTYERRRCGHLPETHPEPLSAVECLSSVVDPKSTGHNKHRYVVASNDIEVRRKLRGVLGVPLVYVSRSVMIMEPMAEATSGSRDRDEKLKFRDGLKGRVSGSVGMKRKRGDDTDEAEAGKTDAAAGEPVKKKKVYGLPKGPNPLSVKKGKKVDTTAKPKKDKDVEMKDPAAEGEDGEGQKKRRKRKHKGANAEEAGATGAADEGGALQSKQEVVDPVPVAVGSD